ncbi:MAG: aldolase, partial [Pseudomonadota bacterium]|nr:aldolase [Pseudomonadota bacterium]
MTDTLRSTVKEKLAVGEVVSSMTVRLVPSVEIVQVIKPAGFDSFYIDLEHSPLTIKTTNQIATTALAAGIDCF